MRSFHGHGFQVLWAKFCENKKQLCALLNRDNGSDAVFKVTRVTHVTYRYGLASCVVRCPLTSPQELLDGFLK